VKAGASGDISPGENGELGPSIAWLNPDAAPSMASPLLYEGNVYVLGRRGGILACLDAETGETRFQERLPDSKSFWASPWACDGKIFCQDDTGGTHVVAPGAEFKILHTNQLEGRFWASTAIADGALLLRSENKLYCVAEAN
jgi:outer membrane protein assembly factor BamB